jgi:hypothetical protein
VNPALLFLIRRSIVNGVLTRLRRLKSPRYLVITLVGVAYFVLLFGPWRERHGPVPVIPGGGPVVAPLEWVITAVSLVLVGWAWVLPSRGPALQFLESEVANLFPAPLTRKELVRYKLLDTQKHLAVMFLFFGIWTLCSSGPVRALMVFFGGWLSLNVLTLHQVGAKLTRQSLLDHGASGFRRQVVPLMALVAFLLVTYFGSPPFPVPKEGAGAKEFVLAIPKWLDLLAASPAGWALYPFRLLGAPAMAPDLPTFLQRAAVLVGMGVLLYAWVMRSDAAFEEAAAEHAVVLTRTIEAAKKGRFPAAKEGAKPPRRFFWRLAPTGPPETAFVWKSLTETLRGISPRLVGVLIAAVAIGFAMGADSKSDPGGVFPRVAGIIMLAVSAILVVSGPGFVGSSLRQELENVETLKTLPLGGARLVRASLTGNVVPSASIQVLFVVIAAAIFPAPKEADLSVAWRLAGAFGLVLLLPALTVVSATVEAAGALLFPAWVRPGQAQVQGGIEGMGYNIVLWLAKGICLAGSVLVPGGIGTGIVFLAVWGMGKTAAPAAVIVASVIATALLLAEVWLASLYLGRRFERLDPAKEGMIQ